MNPSIENPPGRLPQWLGAVAPHLLLLVGAFLLYAQSFGHQWAMDDFMVVARNTDIRSIQNFLNDSYPGRPLREITYLLDYQLFGDNPAGYHIQNILWHGLNASLLVLVAQALGAGRTVAWLAGALFLVHPINVEVVANISHRKDSLLLFFVQAAFLLTIHAYRSEQLKERLLRGTAAGALLGIAALAKETAAGFLPLLLGYELTLQDRRQRVLLRHRWALWLGLAAVLIFAVTWYVLVWQGERFQLNMALSLTRMEHYTGASNALYFLTVCKALAFMVLRLVWPFDLAMEYSFGLPGGWLDPWALAGLGLLAAAGVAMALCRRTMPLVTVGVAWMLAFWLPVSNILWPLGYFAADRYMYAPCAGFALILACLVDRMLARHRSPLSALRSPLFALSGLLLTTLCLLTWRQDRVWADELSLHLQAVKVSPASTSAALGLGMAYMNVNRLDEAKTWLEKAAQNVNDSKPLHILGLVHDKMGNRDEALRYYQKFIQINEARYRMDVLTLKRYLQMRYGQ